MSLSTKLTEKNHLVRKVTRELIKKAKSDAAGGSGPFRLYSVVEENLHNGVPDLLLKRNLTSSEAIGLILLVAAKPTSSGIDFLLWDALGQRARMQKYQGKWMIVHHLLKYKHLELIVYELLIEKSVSPETVFGNYVRLGQIALDRKVKLVDSNWNPPVSKPQRKRGYDDKGSSRPAHRWLPDRVHQGPNPKKKDFSGLYGESGVLNFLYG